MHQEELLIEIGEQKVGKFNFEKEADAGSRSDDFSLL